GEPRRRVVERGGDAERRRAVARRAALRRLGLAELAGVDVVVTALAGPRDAAVGGRRGALLLRAVARGAGGAGVRAGERERGVVDPRLVPVEGGVAASAAAGGDLAVELRAVRVGVAVRARLLRHRELDARTRPRVAAAARRGDVLALEREA